MSDSQFHQSQFELFPSSKDDPSSKSDSKRDRLKNLTLAPENIIVVSIILIIALVVIFSFGVEKGKKLAVGTLDSDGQITADKSTESAIIVKENLLKNPEVVSVEANTEVVVPAVVEDKREILKIPELQEQLVNKNYTIQVASFKTEEYAKKEVATLEKKGFEASVISKGTYSIVCVGKFEHKDEAKKFAERLKHRYNDYLVRRF